MIIGKDKSAIARLVPVTVAGAGNEEEGKEFSKLAIEAHSGLRPFERYGSVTNIMEKADHQDIVELLILALYQDGHLSVAEDSMLQKALVALGWDEKMQTGPAIGNAFSAVREARATDESKEAFLIELTSRIKEAGQSALAFEWLGKVLASDGLDQGEEWHLERVQKMLFD